MALPVWPHVDAARDTQLKESLTTSKEVYTGFGHVKIAARSAAIVTWLGAEGERRGGWDMDFEFEGAAYPQMTNLNEPLSWKFYFGFTVWIRCQVFCVFRAIA